MSEHRPRGIIFDADDTLFDSQPHFAAGLSASCIGIANRLSLPLETVTAVTENQNRATVREYGVGRDRMKILAARIAVGLGQEKSTDHVLRSLAPFADALFSSPPLFPDAQAVVVWCKQAGLTTACVTWSEFDVALSKLDPLIYLPQYYLDKLVVAPADKPKGASSFLQACDIMPVHPQNTLVVGDSWHGDIEPALEIGARAVWITPQWSEQDAGQSEINVPKITNIKELPELISKIRWV